MHRSQSSLSSFLDRRDTNSNSNKKSLWGTIKSKRRGEDNSVKRKSSTQLRPISSVSNLNTSPLSTLTTTNTNISITTEGNNNSSSRPKSRLYHHLHSMSVQPSLSSLSSSSNSRPTSMISYSLDPNANSNANRESESLYSSARNSIYSIRSHSEPRSNVPKSINTNLGLSTSNINSSSTPVNTRFSRIFDADLFNTEDMSPTQYKHNIPSIPEQSTKNSASNSRSPYYSYRSVNLGLGLGLLLSTQTQSRSKKSDRYSVMFGNNATELSQEFLDSLRLIPSNEENKPMEPEMEMAPESNQILSLLFEDYKLALEAYGVGDDVEDHDGDKTLDHLNDHQGQHTSNSSLFSSSYNTEVEELDNKMEVKIFSNCIWIGSTESNIFDSNTKDILINAKLDKIGIKINDDLNGVFSEDDEDEDDDDFVQLHDKRIVQRTSLYFT